MTNHLHMVIDPCDNAESISLLMKRVAGRQTRYVNKLEQRTGSLWEGRFKSSIISTKEYLSGCCRYIELNPLRAGMVADLSEYKWSSYLCKVKGKKDPVVDFSPSYLSLGASASERQQAYSEYLTETIPEYELKLIRDALQRGHVPFFTGHYIKAEVSRFLAAVIYDQPQMKKFASKRKFNDFNRLVKEIFQSTIGASFPTPIKMEIFQTCN